MEDLDNLNYVLRHYRGIDENSAPATNSQRNHSKCFFSSTTVDSNDGLVVYDQDKSITAIIRPAFIGFTLLGFWITQLRFRIRKIGKTLEDREDLRKQVKKQSN